MRGRIVAERTVQIGQPVPDFVQSACNRARGEIRRALTVRDTPTERELALCDALLAVVQAVEALARETRR